MCTHVKLLALGGRTLRTRARAEREDLGILGAPPRSKVCQIINLSVVSGVTGWTRLELSLSERTSSHGIAKRSMW